MLYQTADISTLRHMNSLYILDYPTELNICIMPYIVADIKPDFVSVL
jgi:hypothetical protein